MRLFWRAPKAPGRRPPRDPVKIGVVALLLIVAVTYAAFHKRVPFNSRWTLKGEFANSNQILPGSPVRIAGVTVGQVTGDSRGPGSSAIVTMVIDKTGQPIHNDARLEIHPRLFLEGAYYVQLDPGSPSAPTVKSGYTVPLSNTALPTQFFTVISTLTTPVRASFISSLHELRTGLGGGGAQSFNQLIQQLPPVLRDSSIAAEAAQGTQPNDVSSGIGGISRVTSAFARNDASLGGLVANENQVAGTLASQSAALSASIRELDATLAVAPPALSALDGALPPLKRFSDDLRPALQEAPPVLNGAADLLHDVDVISRPSQLPKLLGVVRPLVEALPTLTSRLEDLFPRVQEVASCINTQAIPALNTKLDDGALSTGRPVWQDLLHGLVGLAANESYFDGNGPVPRLYGGIGPTVLSVLPTGNVLSSGTFLGSRPHWAGPSALPPLRPDVACTTQQLGQLQTPAAPALDIHATGRAPTAGLSAQQLERLMAPRHSRKVAP